VRRSARNVSGTHIPCAPHSPQYNRREATRRMRAVPAEFRWYGTAVYSANGTQPAPLSFLPPLCIVLQRVRSARECESCSHSRAPPHALLPHLPTCVLSLACIPFPHVRTQHACTTSFIPHATHACLPALARPPALACPPPGTHAPHPPCPSMHTCTACTPPALTCPPACAPRLETSIYGQPSGVGSKTNMSIQTHGVGKSPSQLPKWLSSLPILIRAENLLTMKDSSLTVRRFIDQPNMFMSFFLTRLYLMTKRMSKFVHDLFIRTAGGVLIVNNIKDTVYSPLQHLKHLWDFSLRTTMAGGHCPHNG